MKLHVTGSEIVAACCVIGAAAVAYSGNDGWGWLLLIAVLVI